MHVEDVTSHYRPETNTREVLAAPCSANEDAGDCNSFATEPICKEIKTPVSHVCDVAYKSTADVLSLPKAPKRRETKKRKKGRSLILDTPEKKDLRKK